MRGGRGGREDDEVHGAGEDTGGGAGGDTGGGAGAAKLAQVVAGLGGGHLVQEQRGAVLVQQGRVVVVPEDRSFIQFFYHQH